VVIAARLDVGAEIERCRCAAADRWLGCVREGAPGKRESGPKVGHALARFGPSFRIMAEAGLLLTEYP
jgi:hypothetical protein